MLCVESIVLNHLSYGIYLRSLTQVIVYIREDFYAEALGKILHRDL